MRASASSIALSTLLCWSALALFGSAAGAPHAAASESEPGAARAGYLQLSWGPVYFEDTGGSGPALLMLHAASGNSAVWEQQLPAFRAAGYRCIAFDRAGSGRSPASTRAGYTTSGEVEELLGALALERVHLLGVAAGGGAALRYALNHPQRVLSLIVSNSLGDVSDASYRELGRRLRPPEFAALPLELRELGPSYRAANPEGVQRWLALSTQTHPDPAQLPAATAAAVAAPPTANPAAGAAPAAAERAVSFAALRELRAPILLLTGDADLFTPPAVLELFRPHLPEGEFAVIPASGHAAHWENAQAFNRAVLEFLAKARERAPAAAR